VLGPEDPYLDRLRDAARRAREADLWVAVEPDGADWVGQVLGSVTDCPPGSPWREVARPDEGEFRMLAVDPPAGGRGVATTLVQHVLDAWRARRTRAVVLSTLPEMTVAHRLYERFGFVRAPERDWSPVPGVDLLVYELDLSAQA
jgi:ribosomal protein S18 acetylase RimI-like enzyme